jgi:hypothetical protein
VVQPHGGGRATIDYTDSRKAAVDYAAETGGFVEVYEGEKWESICLPRLYGPVADSWCIARGVAPNVEWLTPDQEWQGSIFEAARFELNEREKADRWLDREINKVAEASE